MLISQKLSVVGLVLLLAVGCQRRESERTHSGGGSSEGGGRDLQTHFPPPRADGKAPPGMLIEHPITTTSRVVLYGLEWKYSRPLNKGDFAIVPEMKLETSNGAEYLSKGDRSRRLIVVWPAGGDQLILLQERAYHSWRTKSTLRFD